MIFKVSEILFLIAFLRQEDKHKQEMDAMLSLSKLLPPKNADRLISLFKEYEERETNESKLTKELDVFDAVMQAVSTFSDQNFWFKIFNLIFFKPIKRF